MTIANHETYTRAAANAPQTGGLFDVVPTPEPTALAWAQALPEDDDTFDGEDEAKGSLETEGEAEPQSQPLTLHPYQEQAVDGVLEQFKQKVRSTLVVAATGTGKSIMIGDLTRRASEKDHGVLILVHRDELIRQLWRSCGAMGLPTLIEKADERAINSFGVKSKTVIGSVQTLRGKRLTAWPRDAFRLAIVDEAHHALRGNSYGTVLRHFGLEDGLLRVAGFTATADRLDGENIGQIFESLAFEYNIRDATRDGWLVPIEAVQLKTDPKLDLRQLRVMAGDFNQGDLEREINENIGVLVNALHDTNALESRRTIAFTPNVDSARALALALSDVGISAQAVAGADTDRAAKFAAHQRGDFQVLCNCAIATEGYDDRQMSCVLICRPTKSRALYSQMVGRGTRLPQQGDPPKANCRVVDFAFLTGSHQLVSPVDLYDNSDVPDEVVDGAREMLASGRAASIDEALETAQLEYEQARRVRIQRRVVSVQASKFDPLTACEIYGIPQKANYDWGNSTPATEKQIATLQKMGIAADEGLNKSVASKLLNKLFARREHGWSNPWQVRDLIQSGVDPTTATGMREKDAAAYLQEHPLGPSEKQVKMLKWKGVPDAEIASMTKKDASARIDALMKQGVRT